MKELSIEEKAKAYDEAIKVVVAAYKDEDRHLKATLERIFPELKESGNIRIIKAIKYGLDHVFTNNTTVFEVTKEQCLAWLEKQGEHANFRNKIQIGDKVTRNQDGVLVNLSQLKRVEKPTDKVEPKFKIGDRINPIDSCLGSPRTIVDVCDSWYVTDQGTLDFEFEDNFELSEQKPAWSEEELDSITAAINNLEYLKNNYVYHQMGLEPAITFLKSLKDRVQPQPKKEWTMQDEEELQIALDTLVKAGQHSSAKWLKNVCLRPQNRWKPSDEQMLAINTAINVLGKGTINGKYLIKLQEQLKKLREK